MPATEPSENKGASKQPAPSDFESAMMALAMLQATKAPESRGWKWFVSLGLAAALTGGFGLVSDQIKSARDWQASERQIAQTRQIHQCDAAAQTVNDETPNPMLSERQRAELANEALAKHRECMRWKQ